MNQTKIKNHILALFTVVMWGITFVCTKHLEGRLTALEILFVRYLIAYIGLWIICPKPFFATNIKHELYMVAAAISGAALYQYLENLSVFYTSPSSVAFITATAPIFTALLASRFIGEKFTLKNFIGMIISLFGIFLICFGDSATIETGLLGDLIIFCSIWLWSVYSILVKKIAAFGYKQFLVTRRIFLYSVIMMLPFMLLKSDKMDISALFDIDVAGNLLFLGIIASSLCFASWNNSVEKLGATTTSKYLFISPIVTLIAQAIYSAGDIGTFALIGMAVTLFGLLIPNIKKPIFKKEISKD